MKRAFLLSAIVLALACAKEQPAAVPAAVAPAVPQRVNLLDLGRGAAVVSRTAEHNLEYSAAHAIDGDPDTSWSSPSIDTEHTLVFSLPARARVDRVGATTATQPAYAPDRLVFESSLDGKTFTPLAELALEAIAAPQFADVKPVELRYLRVKTFSTRKQQYERLSSIFVNGAEIEPPAQPRIDGCWTINELPMTMVQTGSRATGVINGDVPIQLDGGTDGRVFRFAWVEGPQAGVAIFSLSPDAAHLSGWWWHESAANENRGEAWFGERRPCAPAGVDTTPVMLAFLRRDRPLPLYGLRFDDKDRLVETESESTLAALTSLIAGTKNRDIRLFAREHRYSADENRERSRQRLAALSAALQKRGIDIAQIKFIPSGSEHAPTSVNTEALQRMHNVIDVVTPRQPKPPPE